MTSIDVELFGEVKECMFEGDRYSVRDNGAVFRYQREGKRLRATDNKWTFGAENSSNPYLLISGVRIHRIVATAFHGEPPDPRYVVDHIDTNCRNNRPENLRWLSRLENVLKNPLTRRRVELLCGSIEAFLDDPSILRNLSGRPNFEWMRSVTPEEAQNCKARIAIWAGSPPLPKMTPRDATPIQKNLNRMHQPLHKWEAGLNGEPGLDFAATPRSAQYMWNSAIHFPLCPASVGSSPLEDYINNLKIGTIFAYSDDPAICPELLVERFEYLRARSAILILCKRAGVTWSIVGIEVTRHRLPHFIHFYLGSYSTETEATNAFVRISTVDFWREGYEVAYKNRNG